MNKMVKFPLILALTGTICATALGVVYQIANPIIEERVNAAANEAIGAVLPGAKGSDITKDYESKKDLMKKYGVSTIYEVTKDGKKIGNGYKVTGQGRNGAIETMVILDDTKILGIKVLSQGETSSFYDKVNQTHYEDKFKDTPSENLETFDTVAGATLSSKGIRGAVINARDAHKEIVLGETVGPKEIVTKAEFEKLGYTGETFEDATEAFKTVQGSAYETDFVGSGKYAPGITNAYYRKDASGNKVGYVYYFNSVYNCEVANGGRANQDYRGLFAFDLDGKNTKIVILESSDSLAAIPSVKPEFAGNENIVGMADMPWVKEFNNKDINEIVAETDSLPDLVAGATFTSQSLISTIEIICLGHKDF